MNSKSGRSQKIKHNYTKIYALIAALCVVAALAVAITMVQLGVFSGKKPQKTVPADQPTESQPASGDHTPVPSGGESSGSEETPTPSANKDYVACPQALVKTVNPLVLVDKDHPFDPKNANDVVNIKNTALTQGVLPSLYTNRSLLNLEALTNLRLLQEAVIDSKGNESKLLINSAYTALMTDTVEGAYDIGILGTKCSDNTLTDPSHSAHATGYCVDVRYADGSYLGSAAKADVTTELLRLAPAYGWLQDRIVNGSFVGVYTSATRDDWHLRYYGVPHSLYMAAHNLTLGEYLAAVAKTNFNKDSRLTVYSPDGKTLYEIYYMKAAESGETRVPVPKDSSYTIWGNGSDGFIVTVESAVTGS